MALAVPIHLGSDEACRRTLAQKDPGAGRCCWRKVYPHSDETTVTLRGSRREVGPLGPLPLCHPPVTMKPRSVSLIYAAVLSASFLAMHLVAGEPPAGVTKVPVVFSGGHDTVVVDRGRPVVLIAAALGVPDEVFREAFSHVRPASGWQGT
jgi:hypothetical protein